MPPSIPHLLLLHFHLLAIASLVGIAGWSRAWAIGVNWGTASSHPLPPPKVVELLKSNNVSRVKLSDADPDVLRSLSGSGIAVTVGIPNLMLRTLNSSKKAAESWVHDNVTRYFPAGGPRVRIEYIAVGDEPFLLSHGDQFYPFVLGAATQIQAALTKANLGSKVKVVVPCSFDAFQSESNLPSEGHFRPDINKTMIQLLTFLSEHRLPFFASISPFLSLHQSKNISLDFALFKGTARTHNDSHRIYKNSFDLSYDTLVTALYSAGFPQMEIVVAQIGWPTDGAANATSVIAEEFMKALINHIHSKTGTPLRPQNPPSEVYILSLLDEDQRSTSAGNFERHWGVFTFDGQAKYHIDLGQGSRKLWNAQNVKYLSSRWCVVNNNADLSNVTASVLDACSVADCTAVSPGGSCYNIGWPRNVSYAFNSYYQQHDQRVNSCYFGGLGLITTVDPSTDTCRFAVGLQTSHSSILVLPQLLLMSSLFATISMGFVFLI
ncbi:glucan endo-1,3-beta-glucosidase 9 isoform X1 [Rhodamnia argentea]|uniref:glucan endo-1,3-beta-D-glucosidase n=1 Tax=Rhodamnia argentea TaxID=178133 RepID=A0A8B8NQL5_9MYRT|nr:glucan endo-1,3-beta-glucosidase 9 isoform X1 [Rhodamnia argentea]